MSGTKRQDGHGMTNKEQRDEYEQKKLAWIIKDLRARGIHNSADKVEEMHKEFITLAK
ncbi:hypothetical protein [Bacillus sp. GFa4/2]|uniref:hypothetical protein n=1 Tax=Bacillus TaxID=1386 RepID=UPI00330040F4|nr:hypothetical protein [Bacillus cereus]